MGGSKKGLVVFGLGLQESLFFLNVALRMFFSLRTEFFFCFGGGGYISFSKESREMVGGWFGFVGGKTVELRVFAFGQGKKKVKEPREEA